MATRRYNNPDKFFRKFGARIKQLRQDRSWTQEDMLSHGYSYRFYQRIESGKPIHLKTALKLADTFGLSIKELFDNL